MRISHWSSDVCSSDLLLHRFFDGILDAEDALHHAVRRLHRVDLVLGPVDFPEPVVQGLFRRHQTIGAARAEDRTSVGTGKSGSVRVDLGGRRLMTKQHYHEENTIQMS